MLRCRRFLPPLCRCYACFLPLRLILRYDVSPFFDAAALAIILMLTAEACRCRDTPLRRHDAVLPARRYVFTLTCHAFDFDAAEPYRRTIHTPL